MAHAMVMFVIGGMGLTCGVHRLWTHKCYKATLPLRIQIHAIYFRDTREIPYHKTPNMLFQNSIYSWVRDHRLHHKYSDTDADPHNSSRGLLFSHIGWLMMKKSELVLQKGKLIDMSDMESDPIVMWEKKLFERLGLASDLKEPTKDMIKAVALRLQTAIDGNEKAFINYSMQRLILEIKLPSA
ncbi:Fatty acid desaturase [Operophtera brumata]|uniref:Fatty acid desaturase n=1 Tax=Operophtera brumata TaxID=104452 RepID=A0A0L7LGA8_OPEBR|nr:Fatty acid desaturase [Operophtera brumata]